MDLVIRCLTKNYAKFSGRARRKEYWLYVLAVIIVFTVMVGFEMALDIQDQRTGLGTITVVLCLASIIPSLAVAVRRLHDTDRSDWWVLIKFIPLIGAIILVVFACLRGTEGENRFGPDPLTK